MSTEINETKNEEVSMQNIFEVQEEFIFVMGGLG
jgi:hypothetical protein